jgi:UDP-2-acetamido-3-amino-2,3-dideoxy-glucuronate N-acetyltransferase
MDCTSCSHGKNDVTDPEALIHPLADVQSDSIGAGTRVWQFVVVLPGARIGRDCNICAHCFIENDVVVGDRVTLKNGVYLWDGLRIEDDVFLGPNATFTNDLHPRSRQRPEKFAQTRIGRGASIGAGAVILPGIEIGAGAMVGAGAVVTRDVEPGATVVGNPARPAGKPGS